MNVKWCSTTNSACVLLKAPGPAHGLSTQAQYRTAAAGKRTQEVTHQLLGPV